MVKKLFEDKNKKNKQKQMVKTTEIKMTHKLRKKMKNTVNKLKINEENLIDAIKAIKSQSENENFFLQILLNKEIVQDDKDVMNKNKIQNFKNKLINLPFGLISEENDLRILVIDEEEEDKLIEKLKLDEFLEERLDILKIEEFLTRIKTTKEEEKLDLKQYTTILVEEKFRNKFQDKKYNFLLHKIVFTKNKKNLENMKESIKNSHSASQLKFLKNRVVKIKIGHVSMSNTKIYKNAKILLLKIVSLVLSSSEKHNGVKTVVLKSEKSLPFELYGGIRSEDLEYFD
jgi:ribosomal protein L1